MRKKNVISRGLRFLLPTVLSITVLAGCAKNVDVKQTSSTGATQVEDMPKIPKNSQGHTVEQQNIYDRIKLTSDPTKVMWIHLIALDGRIINRMPVRNKVTSSGKRLEATHAVDAAGNFPFAPFTIQSQSSDNVVYNGRTDEILQADGCLGESDPYIFWFDPTHRYHQWGTAGGLGYLLTDYPIDLRNPQDIITGLYNADKAAYDWQVRQEEILRNREESLKKR